MNATPDRAALSPRSLSRSRRVFTALLVAVGSVLLTVTCFLCALLVSQRYACDMVVSVGSYGVGGGGGSSLPTDSFALAASVLALLGGVLWGLGFLLRKRRFSLGALLVFVVLLGLLSSLPWVVRSNDRYLLRFEWSDENARPLPVDFSKVESGSDLLACFPNEIWQHLGVHETDVRGVKLETGSFAGEYCFVFWINPRLPWRVRSFIIDAVKERFADHMSGPRDYTRRQFAWWSLERATGHDGLIERWTGVQGDIASRRQMLELESGVFSDVPSDSPLAQNWSKREREYKKDIAALEEHARELLIEIGRREP